MPHLTNDWEALISGETKREYMTELFDFLNVEYKTHTIYPTKEEILSAFRLTPYENVKVVILGQDPYHQPNQAHGLSFSVKEGNSIPPSLRNIYKEIEATTGVKCPKSGDLTRWAEQGVLLLNTVLTVRSSEAGSHRNKGWERFTDFVISLLNERKEPVIFMLWGNYAKKKIPLITNNRHIILTAAHPSPLSAYNGFFGCDHFKKANMVLKEMGKSEIAW
ncbi:MAG: uracil-DNA glycosylase [Oscillospiraceae bacterium]